jgi:hypothetical protein
MVKLYTFFVTAQAEALAGKNPQKKVCMWGARPTYTPFFAESLALAEQLPFFKLSPPKFLKTSEVSIHPGQQKG